MKGQVGRASSPAAFGGTGCFWFPSSRLGTLLQAKLLLCERIICLFTKWPKQELGEIYVPKQELGNEGKGGMRCAFPPYRSGLMVRKTHPTGHFSDQRP